MLAATLAAVIAYTPGQYLASAQEGTVSPSAQGIKELGAVVKAVALICTTHPNLRAVELHLVGRAFIGRTVAPKLSARTWALGYLYAAESTRSDFTCRSADRIHVDTTIRLYNHGKARGRR